MEEQANRFRVLVIDDNEDIHDDIRSILFTEDSNDSASLSDLEMKLFGESQKIVKRSQFEVLGAAQGQEGLEMVKKAREEGHPFCVAFVDVRMPPGWDGVETIGHIRKIDREVQTIICTAYSDYSADELIEQFEDTDNLFVLKKPFEKVEIYQMASALSKKWALQRELEGRMSNLESMVKVRTTELEEANQELKQRLLERQSIHVERHLDRSLKTVGQLAAGLIYEIEKPVKAVSGGLQSLQEGYQRLVSSYFANISSSGVEDTEQKQSIENTNSVLGEIVKEVNRLEKTIAVSREVGSAEKQGKIEVDLNTMIENVLLLTRYQYAGVAEVETHLGKLPPFVCDVGQMYQVFVNILSHAARSAQELFQETRKIKKIIITTKHQDDRIIVTMENQGEKIQEEFKELYEQMLESDEIGKYTGQGLALARSIAVDGHGGQMNFDVRDEQGTVVTISFPSAI